MDSTQTPKRRLVGLTGGIASGKSTVAQELRRLGVGVADADQIAREVVAKGTPALSEIIRAFGADYLTEAGELDRAKLGAHVFGNDRARSLLNAITHPRVAERSAAKLAELARTDTPYVVYDVPLLFETGINNIVDATVVVAVDPETQLNRIQLRDGLDRGAAQARVTAQMPLAEKIARADYVIWNNGTLDELLLQVQDLHKKLAQRFAEIP